MSPTSCQLLHPAIIFTDAKVSFFRQYANPCIEKTTIKSIDLFLAGLSVCSFGEQPTQSLACDSSDVRRQGGKRSRIAFCRPCGVPRVPPQIPPPVPAFADQNSRCSARRVSQSPVRRTGRAATPSRSQQRSNKLCALRPSAPGGFGAPDSASRIPRNPLPARWRKFCSKAQTAFERFPTPTVTRGTRVARHTNRAAFTSAAFPARQRNLISINCRLSK